MILAPKRSSFCNKGAHSSTSVIPLCDTPDTNIPSFNKDRVIDRSGSRAGTSGGPSDSCYCLLMWEFLSTIVCIGNTNVWGPWPPSPPGSPGNRSDGFMSFFMFWFHVYREISCHS